MSVNPQKNLIVIVERFYCIVLLKYFYEKHFRFTNVFAFHVLSAKPWF